MSQPQIAIIGAGISGLVLGRCLRSRGLPAVIYVKTRADPRNGYGITLLPWAYRPLLSMLGLDENAFKKTIAVDCAAGGDGRVSERVHEGFRANRTRFEQLLHEGLDVRWEHELASIDSSTGTGVALDFGGKGKVQSDVVVGGDGPHSQVRQLISPATELKILPFAVYNGKRRVDRETFNSRYTAAFVEGNEIEHKAHNGALLQVSINDRDPKAQHVSISFTYSRPSKPHGEDALFNPRRSKSSARDIPKEFYDEIRSLGSLSEPFASVFDSEALQKDRLLNWLMRSVSVPASDLDSAAERGIVLVGDAVHHTPILGSEGANHAIQDSMRLADFLADGQGKGLQTFHRSQRAEWSTWLEEGERRLEQMHDGSRSNL